MSTFTPNKNIQEPANGSFNNDWDVPVNADWSIIDTAFGGNTQISVTGVAAGSYALTVTQYTPPNIVFNGVISNPLAYVLPAGVGGIWTLYNNTSGAFNLTFAVSGGGSIVLQQGQRSLVVSDGTNVQLADTAAASQAIATAEAFATAADAVVTTNANAFASNAAGSAQNAAETFAQNGSNIDTGQVNKNFLPLIGNMGGVFIQADPGGTPSGTAGQMYFYY
jgi:hypothetical protein